MLHVGTSGWQYAHWRSVFYPKGVPQRRWLAWYAERFSTVELNNSFYRLPERSSFERWREETPKGFVFAVKASRFLTHVRRLRDPQQPVALLLERARGLGDKLGPILVQLPPTMKADPERLDATLRSFPEDVRVAVELRDRSWFSDEIRDILTRHRAALCLADSPVLETPHWRTASWGFVRFHWGDGDPQPCYREEVLDRWAKRIAELWPSRAHVYTYFNNDGRGCALRDARIFARLAESAGLHPTAVREEVHVPAP
jgi:uncharacterized protein YecE (DUF72 family)